MVVVKKIIVVWFVFLVGIGIWVPFVWDATRSGVALLAEGNLLNYQDVIRFHVIAKDNSEEQQELKLRVRDAVLGYLRPELQKAADRRKAAEFIENHLSEIREVAAATVKSAGYAEEVRVVWGRLPFPAKSYGPYVFPAGSYQALEVVIGEGVGKNWWCVLFPSLCYLDVGTAKSSQGEATSRAVGKERRVGWKISEVILKKGPRSLFTWIWKQEPHS